MSDASSHKSDAPVPSQPPAAQEPLQADSSGSQSTTSHGPDRSGQDGRDVHGAGSSNAQLTVISARPPSGVSPTRTVPPLEPANQLVGERLGQFLLQEFIGGGGMGVVFRALDTTLNREVAVKVLSCDQSADDEALRRFRNEAQSAARLNHENIAHVHFVGEDRGVHYIVFEFIEGVNLRDRIEQQGPLPLGEAVSYMFQIAQALDHASRRDVIHRDIKPSNVLITPDGKAKLVDMGLARLNQVAHSDHELTASGVTLGTFDYISPEQARDPRSADVRSDLYSLGCSFFFMLTGRPPFPEGTVLQKLLQHQADHPPDPRVARPELPIEVTWILSRLLAKNPAQRFQHPSELAQELVTFGETLGLNLGATPATMVRPRRDGWLARWQHHFPWAVPLSALFLIVLALDYVWSSGAPDSDVAGVPPVSQPVQIAPGPAAPSTTPATTPFVPNPNAPDPPADDPASPPTTDSDPAPLGQPDEPRRERSSANRSSVPRATDALGAALNVEEFAARAAAASESEARLAPQPLGTRGETGVSAGDAERPVPSNEGSSAKLAAPREGLLVVSQKEQGEHIYSSLHAACNNAKSGDVIELRFTGQMVEEKPITISNMTLSIVAAEEHRPVIVFRPANSVEFTPSMISVVGGRLQATNVHWELDLDVPGPWALFETQRAELLQFAQCSFTIRNASHDRTTFHEDVAFFDIKGSPGGSMTQDQVAGDSPVKIELENCVARGEATFVRDNELQPLRLNWNNGLLATSERLLVAAGGATEPRQSGGTLAIDLRHVTVMLQRGLALLTNSQDAPYQLPIVIHCSDCILATMSDPPLVEQRGSSDVNEYKNLVQWGGERNFFDGFEVFWLITTEAIEPISETIDFDAWLASGANRLQASNNTPVRWKRLPDYDRPFYAHTPGDYALALGDRDNPNPAVRSAIGELDAGCLARLIPMLPLDQSDRPQDVPDDNAPSLRATDDS